MKILQPIIASISINMMHSFAFLKQTPKMFFHYKAMFSDITVPICMGVFRFIDKYISPNHAATTLPCPTPFTLGRICMGTFSAAIDVRIEWIIIVRWAKSLATSLTIMDGYFAPPFRWMPILKSPFINQFVMTGNRTSFSLFNRPSQSNSRLPTNNTLIHTYILPNITANVKEFSYVN